MHPAPTWIIFSLVQEGWMTGLLPQDEGGSLPSFSFVAKILTIHAMNQTRPAHVRGGCCTSMPLCFYSR